ncbi:XRE family transcriptional regulator [Eubacteriales bacterium OttesenSCG-928-G02]|nr:XRE family transcriptional regulator [Eubacteriales bacterium OttesenSCG-928-G02]
MVIGLNNNYELRLYDEMLLCFELSSDPTVGYSVKINKIAERRALLPIDMELTGESVLKWLNRRTIPKNRAYVHNILNTMGLSLRDTKGIIDVCKGLSLNDSYWVVPEGFEGEFADYNLYENRFSEALALTALTGENLSEKEARRIHTSPEFTTNGMLPKAWRHNNDKITLFKGGVWRQYATAPDPFEPYSEYYAAQIADAMGLNPVKYGLSRWKGVLGSTCELFTDIDTAYVPMAGVIRKQFGEKDPSRYYTICGEWFKDFDQRNDTNSYDYFASMLVFDSLILNEDRHLGNFGVLRDNHSGKIIGNAPIFDNGISLFNYSSIQELRKLESHTRAYANYFGQPFDLQAKEFGGALQVEQLSRLSAFKFKRHNRYNWDAERMGIIEGYVRQRAERLIEIIKAK